MSAHHAIHVNCTHTYCASTAIGPARQSRRASVGAKVSERRCKNLSETLRDYIAFTFAVLSDITPSVLIGLIDTIGNLICQSLSGKR